MAEQTKERETYYQCTGCGGEFDNFAQYRSHFVIMANKGDYRHDNWVRLFKDQKGLSEVQNNE